MLGGRCIKASSSTQGAVALSSAEAEFYAMVDAVIKAKRMATIAIRTRPRAAIPWLWHHSRYEANLSPNSLFCKFSGDAMSLPQCLSSRQRPCESLWNADRMLRVSPGTLSQLNSHLVKTSLTEMSTAARLVTAVANHAHFPTAS